MNTENALQDVGQGNDGRAFFKASFTGLDEFHEYCMRSYIVCESGLEYGDVFKVATLFDGDIMDLSADGTANSYIVPGYGYYSFDATVKGNGLEPIDGTPVSAEVIWETRNIADAISTEDVVENISLKNGKVLFNTSEDFNQGNALIAVKDASTDTTRWGVDAWYPAAGYRNPDNYKLEKVGKMGGYWTASFGGAAPYDFVLSSGGLYPLDMKSAAYGQSVRCQKIE